MFLFFFSSVFRTSGTLGRLWNRQQPTEGLVECGNKHTLRLDGIALSSVYLELHGQFEMGVISRGTFHIAHITGLITTPITTHEPPSRLLCFGVWGLGFGQVGLEWSGGGTPSRKMT